MLAGLRERHFGERLRGTPHVARFEDAFEHGGSLWLVFVDEGFSLHDLLYTSSRESGGGAVVVQPSPFWLQVSWPTLALTLILTLTPTLTPTPIPTLTPTLSLPPTLTLTLTQP